jgi:membrane-anchored mycosin MYCP
VPAPAPPPDLRPRNTALIGAGVVAALALAVVAGAAVRQRRT